MRPLLFDEGLPGGAAVPTALSTLGWEATAVGSPGAPGRGGDDKTNCLWCKSNQAVLVTHDRGRKDREIFKTLDQLQVGVILVLKDLRQLPPRHLALAILRAEREIDTITGSKRLRHQLRKTGKLVKP